MADAYVSVMFHPAMRRATPPHTPAYVLGFVVAVQRGGVPTS